MNPTATDARNVACQQAASILNLEAQDNLTLEQREKVYFDGIVSLCESKKWRRIDTEEACKALEIFCRVTGQNILFALNQDTATQILKEKPKLTISLFPGKFNEEVLHEAARLDRKDLVDMLLNEGIGATIDQVNSQGQTPLHVAILAGKKDMVQELVKKRGANVERRCKVRSFDGTKEYSLTSSALAVSCGQIDCLDALLTFISKFRCWNTIEGVGNLLHVAIDFNQEFMLSHFLRKYPDTTKEFINIKNDEGYSPLHLAVILGREEMVPILVGADFNYKTDDGYAPIHLAAKYGHKNMIRCLCELGADINMPCEISGKTKIALQLADDNGHCESANLLKTIQSRPFQHPNFEENPPVNLVFKGGGPKGLAYIGIIEKLEERNLLKNLKRIAGTSSGAITATLLALGFSSNQIKEFQQQIPLTKFLDYPGSRSKEYFGVMQEAYNKVKNFAGSSLEYLQMLWTRNGICEGDYFRDWIDNLIKQRTGITHCTFSEFAKQIRENSSFKHLHIFSTRVKDGKVIRFSSENLRPESEWGDLVISDAVRASMSIPVIFKAHTLHFKRPGSTTRAPETCFGTYVDGGLLRNFPINAFDYKEYTRSGFTDSEREIPDFNSRTLGFCLYSPSDKESIHHSQQGVVGLLWDVAKVFFAAETLISESVNSVDSYRVVKIDNKGVGLLDFDLDKDVQQNLIESGRDSLDNFLDKGKKVKGNEMNFRKSVIPMIGREEQLRRLQELLVVGDDWVSEQSVRYAAIQGSEGMGKTLLAQEFVRQYVGDFSCIYWVNQETPLTCNQSYALVGKSLGIILDGKSPAEIRKEILDKLEKTKFKKPWLLILDGIVEGIFSRLKVPTKGGRVLIITRNEEWALDKHLCVVVNSLAKKKVKVIEFFRQKWPEVGVKEENIQSLLDYLEFHPFALQQALAYLNQSKKDVASYLNMLEQINIKKEDHRQNLSILLQKACRSTLDHLHLNHPMAFEWLNLCAYLHPSNIPQKWLINWLKAKKSSNPTQEVQEILSLIQNFELMNYVNCDKTTESFSMHPLIQEAIKIFQQEKGELLNAYQSAFDVVEKTFEDEDKSNYSLHMAFLLKNEMFKKISNSFDVLKRLVNVLCNSKQHEEALQCCKEYRKHHPDHTELNQLIHSIQLNITPSTPTQLEPPPRDSSYKVLAFVVAVVAIAYFFKS